MVKKSYDWKNGAALDDHSRVKLRILDEYFREYLRVRCVLPQQEKFRLAVVDGFSGAGIYEDGSFGSPLVLLNALRQTEEKLNLYRAAEGFRPIVIECYFSFNDVDPEAINLLRENSAGIIAEINECHPNVELHTSFHTGEFEQSRRAICQRIQASRVRSALFNLDQYGYTQVSEATLIELMNITRSAEVFLTFAIESFLTYLSPERIRNIIGSNTVPFAGNISNVDENQTKPNWLGSVEKVVFETLRGAASYVSPFSIHNPDGWRYWLIHFANSFRARQVYNDVLHRNKSSQAHFGRSGLSMLHYNPRESLDLYLFNQDSRGSARKQLLDDIPDLVGKFANALLIGDFYKASYNETPAHSDDINFAIINNPDLEVVTQNGGLRRSANTIRDTDVLKLRDQTSFFSLVR
ncbi:three-Cys-motif partner protein TcmP [Croceicoccus naphthovorans]|uniref:Uncharacterized protein n=1 Tax=Croceicoccus naphthovorans TaxID=1348774 RepID=A0A0G3XJS3_9SPHN|nr:three-Cys-motif partner protein TcmP [Croceicoccus naphthovorans]AKM10608.1 hypothetical protein AB433_12585 [Croceicoccus naphthovorans]MBB3988831.1 three-Cys-motif partner protein [Croceicoccus naphthovorans]